MMSKKMIYSLVGVFVISVIFGYVFVSVCSEPENEKTAENISASAVEMSDKNEDKYYSNGNTVSTDKKADGEDERYLFRDYEGKLAVYRIVSESDIFLYYLTDINISYLPEKDREEIKKGIVIDSRKKMLTLLEDFGS